MASNTIQFNDGGIAIKVKKIITKVRPALNVLLFIFLFIESSSLIPEYSSLIICKPMRPKTNGNIKLTIPGKKERKFSLKKLLKKTSKIPNKIKVDPRYK